MPSGRLIHDTIVAVSSPPGRSMRGLVRLTGSKAFEILDQIATSEADAQDRTLTAARLRDPDLPVLAARFRGPGSYTGQDAAELQLPGNPALLDAVLHACVDRGARLAEPGEFTFRAFLAGRLDLTRAEGIAATIAATSDGQLRAAGLLRAGRLGTFATDLADRLGNLLALVEAGIDFTDQEGVVPIPPGKLDEGLREIEADLTRLLARSRSWGALEALPRVVLAGPPSAGKSTLFNALLGHDRAVIHEQPGTTRDVLEEPLELNTAGGTSGGGERRIEVMLVDIAGLDDPVATLDRAAQRLAGEAIERADLILRLTPVGPESGMDMRGLGEGAPVIDVRTMIDREPDAAFDERALPVSAVTRRGLDALRSAIAQRVGERGVSVAGDMLALQPRHETALRGALEGLGAARRLLINQRDDHAITEVELVAAAVRDALDALASLGGQLTPDDIIGRVFATFCVGK